MIKAIIYNAVSGEIDRTLYCPKEWIEGSLGSDEAIYYGEADGATHIVNNKPVVKVRQKAVEEVRFAKLIELKIARDRDEVSGFDYLGKVFDSDETSMRRIGVAVQAAVAIGPSFTIDWTCQDNSIITLTHEQMLNLPVAMAVRGNQLHQKYRELKEQVNLAGNLEEIQQIIW